MGTVDFVFDVCNSFFVEIQTNFIKKTILFNETYLLLNERY